MMSALSLLASLLALSLGPTAAHAADAADFDCAKISADGHTFDLKALGGPHTVVTTKHHAPSVTNTTWTVDICAPLRRKGDVKDAEACPEGTRGSSSQSCLPVCRAPQMETPVLTAWRRAAS
jgi:hypothetical protein